MIDKTHDSYELSCDVCGDSADQSFDEFAEAVEFKKENGMVS